MENKKVNFFKKKFPCFPQANLRKRGFQLTIGTIVLLVLGVMVLAGLFILFVTQIDFFKENVFNLQSKNNVDAIVGVCQNFVNSEQLYNYCCEIKKINAGGEEFETTCEAFSANEISGGRIEKLDCSETFCKG